MASKLVDPFSEDWGYVEPLPNRPFKMWLGCGHQSGDEDTFLVFIEPSKPQIRSGLFKKTDTREEVEKVANALEQVLIATSEIHDVTWIESAG